MVQGGVQSPFPPPPPVYTRNLKHNLPELNSAEDPGQDSWEVFPFNPLPALPTLAIDWRAFKKAIDSVSPFMSPSQCDLAPQVISDLEHISGPI